MLSGSRGSIEDARVSSVHIARLSKPMFPNLPIRIWLQIRSLGHGQFDPGSRKLAGPVMQRNQGEEGFRN